MKSRVLSRRRFISTAAAVPLSAGVGKLHAFENCDILVKDMPNGLDVSNWIPAGSQKHEKTVYAVVAPWCPYCAELFSRVSAGEFDISFRFIPADARDSFDQARITKAFSLGGDRGIEALFDRRDRRIENSPFHFALNNIQQQTYWSIWNWSERIMPSMRFGTPYLLSSFDEGPFIGYGGMGLLDDPALMKRIATYPHAAASPGIERTRAYGKARLHPPRRVSFASGGYLLAAPNDAALPRYCFGPNSVLPTIVGEFSIGNERWFISEDSEGLHQFVRGV